MFVRLDGRQDLRNDSFESTTWFLGRNLVAFNREDQLHIYGGL